MTDEAPRTELPPPPPDEPSPSVALPPPPEGVPPPPPEEGEAVPEAKPKKKVTKKRPSYQLKLFERWDLNEVVVHDKGLERYINLSPIVLPHTGGRHANKPFGKGRTNIVERIINNMMRFELYTGKKSKALKVVRQAFEIIEETTKKHPVQVLVDALQKAAPREEITRLRFGGISVPRAVDIAPSRRLDLAVRNICLGAVLATFKGGASKKDKERERGYEPIAQALANEILSASRGDMASAAISRKDELERIAASAR
jgi:small subunit ribosomal protein S7